MTIGSKWNICTKNSKQRDRHPYRKYRSKTGQVFHAGEAGGVNLIFRKGSSYDISQYGQNKPMSTHVSDTRGHKLRSQADFFHSKRKTTFLVWEDNSGHFVQNRRIKKHGVRSSDPIQGRAAYNYQFFPFDLLASFLRRTLERFPLNGGHLPTPFPPFWDPRLAESNTQSHQNRFRSCQPDQGP